MAVLGHLRVEVRSGGETLLEYDVPAEEAENEDVQPNVFGAHNPTRRVTKYIEAIPGADYEIRSSLSEVFNFRGADYLSCHIHIDRKWKCGAHLEDAEYQRRGYDRVVASGERATIQGVWKKFPFRWAQLVTSEEAPKAKGPTEMKALYEELGTIKVEVWRKVGTTTGPKKARPFSVADTVVPEKAIKGQAVDLSTTANLDAFPIARFIFKYRSRNALQVLGIIPRSSSPVPLEDRDPDTLTREEAILLLRRQKAQIAQASIKCETSSPKHKIVKRERPVSVNKELDVTTESVKKARRDIEVIDLTD